MAAVQQCPRYCTKYGCIIMILAEWRRQIQRNDVSRTGLEIDFINEKYRLKLPVKEDYETLSGMIISFAETIPENGAVFNIENYQLKVLEVHETKISTVELKILEKD
jgi:CBS domain containing-hemolysin-like protein